jgi:antitoxin MazE
MYLLCNYILFLKGQNMRIVIAQVGNSKGVRIPKAMLEACGFGAEAEIEVKRGTIVLTPVTSVREGWREAAKENKKALEAKWEW